MAETHADVTESPVARSGEDLRCFFITGHNRSGTNLVSKVLNEARNARVFEELSPKMGYEAREKHEGHFPSREAAKGFIKAQKHEHIKLVNEMGYVFGDKNANYIPFLSEMAEVWASSKFVIVIRDGRDVVTSYCNFYASTGKKVFQMAEDVGEGGDRYPVCNLWDYSRLRPRKGEELHEEWQDLDLFSKSCFSWAYTNEILFDVLQGIARERYFLLNTSAITLAFVRDTYEFLGLEGFDETRIGCLLRSGVNRSRSRIESHWGDWTESQRSVYEGFCGDMHRRLLGELKWVTDR
jgi:hypothetical protein